MDSPSLESSTLASAVPQNSNEAFSAATSLSLPSVSAIFASGAGVPEIFAHKILLDCAMCMTTWPKLFISGVGLNPYLSAGIASAAATMFLAKRVSCAFTVVLTGLATGAADSCACAATATNSSATDTTATKLFCFIDFSPLVQNAGSIPPNTVALKPLSLVGAGAAWQQ